MVCAHVAFHAGPFESSKYRRSGRSDLLGDKSCRAKEKKKKSIFSTHDARTSGTRVPSGLLSRIHTLEAYTRNTNIMESAGYGEGRGGRGLCELAAWYHRSTGNETAPDQEELICPQCSAYSPFCP